MSQKKPTVFCSNFENFEYIVVIFGMQYHAYDMVVGLRAFQITVVNREGIV